MPKVITAVLVLALSAPAAAQTRVRAFQVEEATTAIEKLETALQPARVTRGLAGKRHEVSLRVEALAALVTPAR